MDGGLVKSNVSIRPIHGLHPFEDASSGTQRDFRRRHRRGAARRWILP